MSRNTGLKYATVRYICTSFEFKYEINKYFWKNRYNYQFANMKLFKHQHYKVCSLNISSRFWPIYRKEFYKIFFYLPSTFDEKYLKRKVLEKLFDTFVMSQEGIVC